MKINPQRFFNFCANHAPLLRGLADTKGELSEAEVRRLIRSIGSSNGELPETTWRSLRELQILVPSEAGSDSYFVAPPVNRLIEYLFDEARPRLQKLSRVTSNHSPRLASNCLVLLKVTQWWKS